MRIIAGIITDASLHHPHHLVIPKPSIQLTLGLTASSPAICCRPEVILTSERQEARLMTWLKGGGGDLRMEVAPRGGCSGREVFNSRRVRSGVSTSG